MNKIEFINKLLKIEKITAAQKARVIALAQDELSNFENSENVLFGEIKKIKRKIGLNDTKSEEDTNVVTPRINLTQSPSIAGTAISESDQVVIQNRILQELSTIANRNMPGVPNPNAKTNDLSRQKELFLKVIGLKKGTYELTLEDAKEFMPEKFFDNTIFNNKADKFKPEEIDSSISVVNKESVNPSLPRKYYNPSGLHNYLLAYNQDPILKSTCHLIDSNELEKINEYCNTNIYDFEKHYAKIIESFNKINDLFAPPYIKALIRGYLSGQKFNGEELRGWSDHNIIWHWSHKKIKDWTYENPGVPPNPDVGLSEKLENGGFEFVTPIRIKEEYLQSLGDLVIHFKKMFHVREDNSLLKILQGQNAYRNWNDKIDFRLDKSYFSENIEFFTDIDKLLQSYNEIIQLIIEFKKDEKPIVLLGLSENENSIYFSINCTNGVYGKSLASAKNRLIGQKYEAIIKKLNGLCNIYLQANFGQNVFSKLTLWDDEWNIQKERVEHSCDDEFKGGVQHILEFKRR